MRKNKIFIIKCLLISTLVTNIQADGSFVDADKSIDEPSLSENYDLRHTIPGEPDIDYPIYSKVPKTKFLCKGRHEGYYADVETRCQAFRICAHTARSPQGFGFLCPNGTLFNQKHFVCDWYRNVNCDESQRYYSMNKDNRIGSNFDMMETVRQMMEYPMKTISKALQQTATRTPIMNKNKSKLQKTEVVNRKSAITRAQVESVHNNGIQHKVQEIKVDHLNEHALDISESHQNTDVYVNSLGELSTDPGIKFNRTNAHIIAEPASHRTYHYGKKNDMNFAEKVNAALNDYVELPKTEPLAPDYVKNMRREHLENVELASNINSLLEEISTESSPNESVNTATKSEVNHQSVRYLSRGFATQGTEMKAEEPYSYKKPKQTPQTVRFTPNDVSTDSEQNSQNFETDNENISFTIMMKNEDKNEDEDITEQTTEANEESTPFIINDISEIAQSESLQQESAINSIGATLETLTQSNTEQSEVQSSDSSPTKEIFENQLDSTINLNETYSNSDTDIKIQEESTTISQEDADDLIAENDNEYIKVDEDANNHAASLLLAGVKQSSLENNVTYNTVLNNSIQNNEENYVSNSINEQDLSTTTTTESLPESSTTTEMSTSTETITEINSVQERIRAYRRFSSLQRATAKPVIYAKRANVKAITRTTTSTTASPVSTTKSYLKRVAASRLRLAKLNAAHKKETNENYVESETSKKYIRNLEKETGIKTDLSNGPNPLSTAASNNEQSQAVATWESVRNNLQRYMQRKRSGQTDYGYQTATRPSTTATPTTISSRRYNIVSRNRFSNFKTQVNSRRQTSSTSTTTEIPISTAAPVTSRPPAISVTHSTSEQISTSFKTPDLSHLLNSITKGVQLQSSNTNTIPTNTFAAGLHKNTNTFTKSTSSSSTSSSPSPNLETDNFISFDKLTRAIVDESILQNFRSNQHSSKTHLVSNEVVPIAISTNKPINTDTFIDKTTSNVVIPSKSPVFLPQLPSMPIQQKITPATPRIVIARAEGQRIEPNSASIISNLAAQHQPKPSNGANSYVALDDFLNRKFGSSNNGNSQVSNSVDQHFKQIGIQIPKVQVPPQFQTAAATQTKYAAYQNSVQPHLNHFQQNLNPSFQQQVQSNNYQTTLNLQNPAHSQPVYQQQHQTFSINPKNSIPQKHSNAPFATQNIFANFHQQQQQLPQFPPLAQGSARSSNINSNHGYLNVQLPVLPKGLIPAPTTQVAQKRSDNFEAEYAIPTSRLRATPRFLHYNVVSSYDVPLSSVGRLSNDITKVTRRLRKY